MNGPKESTASGSISTTQVAPPEVERKGEEEEESSSIHNATPFVPSVAPSPIKASEQAEEEEETPPTPTVQMPLMPPLAIAAPTATVGSATYDEKGKAKAQDNEQTEEYRDPISNRLLTRTISPSTSSSTSRSNSQANAGDNEPFIFNEWGDGFIPSDDTFDTFIFNDNDQEAEAPASAEGATEEEQEEEAFGPQKFWARAVVRVPRRKTALTSQQVSIKSVSISPERIKTFYGHLQGKKRLQGAHIVAWSATLPYWQQRLKGKLSAILVELENWILADQVADTDSSGQNKPRRARALYLVETLKHNPLPLNKILDYLEEAISLFIAANQFSSFATHGKSHGGNAEANALQYLQGLNDLEEEEEEPEFDEDEIARHAVKLLDLNQKVLTNETKARVIWGWYHTLLKQFPAIENELSKGLLKVTLPKTGQAKNLTVQQWLKEWEDLYANGVDTARQTLRAPYLVSTPLASASTSATSAPSSTTSNLYAKRSAGKRVLAITADTPSDIEKGEAKDSKLAAQDILIKRVEIPARLRAPTYYGTTQQSHTIAWTFKRQSLIARFRNITADVFLTRLKDMVIRDLQSLEQPSSTATKPTGINARAQSLRDQLEALPSRLNRRMWMEQLNLMLIEAIEINQALPLSTYAGADRATGHGESASNRRFHLEREAELSTLSTDTQKAMRKAAPRYLDLGIFYVPLIKQIGERGDISSKQRIAPQQRQANATVGAKRKRLEADAELQNLQGNTKEDFIRAQMEAQADQEKKQPSRKRTRKETNNNETVPASTTTRGVPLTAIDWFCIYLTNKNSKEAKAAMDTLDVKEFTKLEKLALEGHKYLKQFPKMLKNGSFKPPSKALQQVLDNFMTVAEDISDIDIREAIVKARKFGQHFRVVSERAPGRRAQIPTHNEEALFTYQTIETQLQNPTLFGSQYIKQQEGQLQKIIGDFYRDMAYFNRAYYDYLRTDPEARIKLLRKALMAPLLESDNRIGGPLKSHLMDQYTGFIEPFWAKIEETIKNEWAYTLFDMDISKPKKEGESDAPSGS